MARTPKSIVTVELYPGRAGPFELLFLDAGGFKHAPEERGDLVFGLLT